MGTSNQSRNTDLSATKVVPVIFLPSIMGSNLKHKDTGDSDWRIRRNLALTAMGCSRVFFYIRKASAYANYHR